MVHKMSYALTIYRDGESLVSEIEYAPDDKGDIVACIPFASLIDAHHAKNVHNIAKMAASEDTAKLEVQAAIIRSKNTEIDNLKVRIVDLKETVAYLTNAASEFRRVLRRVMSQLALQNVLPNTHSERNAENRSIIGDMKYWHDKELSSYTEPSLGLDDIPF